MSSETSRYGQGWSMTAVIPPSMRAAVALVVTFIGWDRFSAGPACGRRADRGMAPNAAGRSAKVGGQPRMADRKGNDAPGVRSPRFPRSKFHAPSGPSRLVRRSRLLDALDRGRQARLTLVMGSPGAGKTALLADWLAAHPERPTAWLSCDPADAVRGPVCGCHHRSPATGLRSGRTGRGRPPTSEPRRRGVRRCHGRPGRRP